jgi:hypothetical protein
MSDDYSPDASEPDAHERRLVPRFPPDPLANGHAGEPDAGNPEQAEHGSEPEERQPQLTPDPFAFPIPPQLDLAALDRETVFRSFALVAGTVAIAAGIVALAVCYSRRRGVIPAAGVPMRRGSANTVSLTPRRSGGNQAGRIPRFWVELGYRSRQAFRDAWHAGKFSDRTIEGVLKAVASP